MEEENKLQLNDLLSGLGDAHKEEVPQFLDKVNKSRSKKIQKISKKRQEELKRQQNYNLTKQELDKWLPIVKTNREKDTLNFQQRDQTTGNTVNFFPSKPISKFHEKIDSKLASLNVANNKQIIKHEQAILEKLDPEEAKKRLIEARKHRTAIFYEEQKRRRIAKIKSKLYRKIKKRQRMRQQAKKMETLNASERQEYVQKLTKNRIKERITLRHKTKNKHIQNLLRFNKNQKDYIQASINEVNEVRMKQLQKVNQQMLDDISQEYDDQNFREKAIEDLEAELQAIEQENDQQPEQDKNGGLSDLKFIQLARQRRKNEEKVAAKKLLKKLNKKQQDLDVQDLESDKNSEQNDSDNDQISQEEGRKVYGKKIDEGKFRAENQNKRSIEDKLNKHLSTYTNEELIQGINIDKLKQKYQPERVEIDLADLIANNKEIYEGQNEAAMQNVRQFQQQKLEQYEQQIQPEKKPLKGWGSWAGPGIKQKKIDPKQQLKRKLQKIEQLKKKRKDSSLAHVTINENRNKTLSDYFVRYLPHSYANADQFDYMQNEPIGPEWNSLNQFKDNIKPKVITKTGQVISSVNLPKKIEKLGKNSGYGGNI